MKTATSGTFRKSTAKLVDEIVKVIDEFSEYKPLTLRQIYYRLVGKQIIENNQNGYQKISRLLVKARQQGFVDWADIADRTRYTTQKRGSADAETWLRERIGYIDPKYYGRCLVSEQDNYVEVSTEKDAIATILETELWIYCTRLNVIRGQGSQTIVEQMARRFEQSLMLGKNPILLHFGDLDPSGRAIPRAIKNTLYEIHDVDVDVRVIALTPEQVNDHQLPHSIDAVKKTDPNYKKWLLEYGPYQPAVELDALHPEVLKGILKNSLSDVYDIDSMIDEQEIERDERLFIRKVQNDVRNLILQKYPGIL